MSVLARLRAQLDACQGVPAEVAADLEVAALLDIAEAAWAYAHGRGPRQSLLDALARLEDAA